MNVLYEVFHKCDYINMIPESLYYYFSITSTDDIRKIIETLNLIRNFHKIYQY